ncbi:MAG: 8-oxo-dGTP diphosphatase [Chloroflexota bacterium]
MQDTTLVLLLKDAPPTEVLLGYKKMGFGQGKYTGFGGKIEPGERVAEAASRELAEETGILLPVASLEIVATLTFIFPYKPEWSQRVHVFTAHKWNGEPAESNEMRPQWFAVDAIPYDQMWDDARYWLLRVLSGEKFQARFMFKGDNETVGDVEIEFLLSD